MPPFAREVYHTFSSSHVWTDGPRSRVSLVSFTVLLVPDRRIRCPKPPLAVCQLRKTRGRETGSPYRGTYPLLSSLSVFPSFLCSSFYHSLLTLCCRPARPLSVCSFPLGCQVLQEKNRISIAKVIRSVHAPVCNPQTGDAVPTRHHLFSPLYRRCSRILGAVRSLAHTRVIERCPSMLRRR